MKIKKIYKIKNKLTGLYVSLGYKSKNTWLSFPSEAISTIEDKENYQIDVFEAIKTKSLTLNKEEIK